MDFYIFITLRIPNELQKNFSFANFHRESSCARSILKKKNIFNDPVITPDFHSKRQLASCDFSRLLRVGVN